MDGLMGLAGGVLIGLAAVLLMLVAGRIAGISGIIGGLVVPVRGDVLWRTVFVLGLFAGATLITMVLPGRIVPPTLSGINLILAGLLVGFGATLGNGCTSGHGVCGLPRFSGRSLAAVLVFMATAMVTVGVVRHGF